jgi:hypothetical protein
MAHYFCLIMEFASAMVLGGLLKDICEYLMEDDK